MKSDQILRAAFSFSDTIQSPTTMEEALNYNGARSTVIGPLGSAKDKGILTGFGTIKRIANMKDLRDAEEYKGAVTGNPGQVCWMTVNITNDLVATAKDCYVRMRILYYCCFFDPINVA